MARGEWRADATCFSTTRFVAARVGFDVLTPLAVQDGRACTGGPRLGRRAGPPARKLPEIVTPRRSARRTGIDRQANCSRAQRRIQEGRIWQNLDLGTLRGVLRLRSAAGRRCCRRSAAEDGLARPIGSTPVPAQTRTAGMRCNGIHSRTRDGIVWGYLISSGEATR